MVDFSLWTDGVGVERVPENSEISLYNCTRGRLYLGPLVHPGLNKRLPAQIRVIVVDHPTTGHCGWRGHGQVLHLKQQRHLPQKNSHAVFLPYRHHMWSWCRAVWLTVSLQSQVRKMSRGFQSCSHLFRHGDSLSIDERKHLVVIHNRVHALDPQSVNRPVKQNPLLVLGLI